MSPEQFREAIAGLGWSQLEAARQLDVEPRTVRRWVAGDRAIPSPVRIALDCMRRLRACRCGNGQQHVPEG